jgi:hypothetical protein
VAEFDVFGGDVVEEHDAVALFALAMSWWEDFVSPASFFQGSGFGAKILLGYVLSGKLALHGGVFSHTVLSLKYDLEQVGVDGDDAIILDSDVVAEEGRKVVERVQIDGIVFGGDVERRNGVCGEGVFFS